MSTSTYITNTAELASIANAIRTKCEISSALIYPSGYIDALSNISGGPCYGDQIFFKTISSYSDSTITTIGSCAFRSCIALSIISFPACITINDYAFQHCESITTATFPVCTTIGSRAFFHDSKLTTATFPRCTTIGSTAFYNCKSLTTASFPVCTTVGSYAFESCYALTTISFPACVTIEAFAFQDCRSLSTIFFPSCMSIMNNAFAYCYALTTVSFPACTSIGNYVFQSCFSLTTAYFPACTTIGMAFQFCRNLLSLYLLNSSVAALSNASAFKSTPISDYTTSTGGVYGSIFVRASLLTAWQTATNWSLYSSRFVGLTDEEIAALG